MNNYLNRNPTDEQFDFEEKEPDYSPFRFFQPDNTPCTAGVGDIRQVAGCGRKSGFQLIIDNHKMENLMEKGKKSKGYYVFVTVPGVVTSKVPFTVNPAFEGEHNFYMHGIHVIGVRTITISK
jgi:hypothetical protein